jgi:hypothetical protein
MRKTIVFLIVFFVASLFNPVTAKAQSECEKTKERAETWERDDKIPNQLVTEFIAVTCELEQTSQKIKVGEASVDELIKAQERFLAVYANIHKYWRAYSPLKPTDAETVEKWLQIIKDTTAVPTKFEINVSEAQCEMPGQAEEFTCDISITMTAEGFKGHAIEGHNTLIQQYAEFEVYRLCEFELHKDNLIEAFQCPVVWVTLYYWKGYESVGIERDGMINSD